MRMMFLSGIVLLTAMAQVWAKDEPGNSPNPAAVDEVKSGKRTTANAAWWGFNEDDVTDSLQAAINSGAKTVIIPNVGQDWVVRPIRLAGNQELILERGVVVTAKRGEFHEGGDSVFTAADVDHLTIKGEGATIRMQKEDYIVGLVLKDLGWNRWFGQYTKAEWRMTLAIRGCNDVTVEGLKLADSGGDGIYIDGGNRQRFSRKIVLRKVHCDNNYRQGISVISVDDLLIEDSQFNNTWGTPPSAGIDIEPDSPDHRLTGIVVRNCEFLDNYGDGIEVFLAHQTKDSEPVSILFDNCRINSRRGPGMRVTKMPDNGVRGSITFQNIVVENTEGFGIKVQDKSPNTAHLSFINCRLRSTARNRSYADGWAPIVFRRNDKKEVTQFGGVEFRDCAIEDHRDRPPVLFIDLPEIVDLNGNLTVKNPNTSWQNQEKERPGQSLKLSPNTN